MKSIVRVDKNWGIGKDGQLLSFLPDDMKFFRNTTKDKVVIMGRKTLESFPGGEPLKNRVNIVLSTNMDARKEGCIVCRTAKEALKAVEAYNPDDVYIIGGQAVYELFLPYCDTAYVTYMENAYDPDTWYVNLDQRKEWNVTEVSESREYEGIRYEFRTYRRDDPPHTDGEEGGECH